jgi:hypothetical protein
MKDQFEVWDYNFPTKGLHPVVLISHPDICARQSQINVLFCTSQRQSRRIYPHEVMLDTADGLDWETFCDCSTMYLVPSDRLARYRGKITYERQQAIRCKVRDLFRLMETD